MRFAALPSVAGAGPVDQPHLVDQAAVGVREIDDARGRALRSQCALEPLDEPGAERVQPFEFFQIDVDAARGRVAAGGGVDDFLELGGALGRPGAGRGQRDALAPTLPSPACGGGSIDSSSPACGGGFIDSPFPACGGG